LNDKSIVGIGADQDQYRPLKSMLVGPSALAELPSEAIGHRCFKIRAAESPRERRSAKSLIDRMYETRGYQTVPLCDEEFCDSKTFLASDHNAPIGTLTIGFDSSDGLFVDELFPDEVGRFRAAGLQMCEFTKLAMDRRARSPRLLASLFHIAYIYAHRIRTLDNLLIEVNPRHVRYYEIMLGFKVVAATRHNSRVNAPAVLLSLDLSYAEEQIHRFGGRPKMSAGERSAYPYFFSAHDETGIIGRLQQTEEDIADVFDFHRPVAPLRHVHDPLH
jgi:hypothetical protein